MVNLEATFTDISGWHKNVHYSTGGTRSKYIALHPDTNEEYFFKGSKETPSREIRYPTEFWSEIVSSKIGQVLGFPMLDYNIAFDDKHKQKMGCFSKSMINISINQLIEGKRYLTGFDEKYNAEKDKKLYTFQFIKSALIKSDLEYCIPNIIEIIVFDSIIGNSDRHQENWGIIADYSYATEEIKNVLTNSISSSFAPIYDSGCCLGREHTPEKVLKMLNDSQMIEAYIRKGDSEIHWEGHLKKRKHFELIELLLENYPIEVEKVIAKVKKKHNSESIKEIIENIDINLPKDLVPFKLSESRKQLMFKLVTLRIEKLIQYL